MTEWKVIGEELYRKGVDKNPLGNKHYGYRKVFLELPDGREGVYFGVDVSRCVHIVPVEDDLTTYLVWQSRPNAMLPGGKKVPRFLEFPGGFRSRRLNLENSAQLELTQEIGRYAGKITKLGVILPSVGLSNERDHIYLGEKLEQTKIIVSEEPTEQDIRVESFNFGTIYDRTRKSKVPVSAQTLSALSMAEAML